MAGPAMQITHDLTVDDFDYELPERLIAQHPLPERSASRLLEVDGIACRTAASPICRSCCALATCWCSTTRA
jgi:hypothetical protein